MTDLRATLWVRYPDETEGPLWAAVHVNRRAGADPVVGFQIWTEPPGTDWPEPPGADPAADLLPWPARGLTAGDLAAVRLPALAARLLEQLEPLDPGLSGAHSAARRGRPPRYGPEHWRSVAAAWGRAGDPRARTRAVAEAFSVSRSTAQFWVLTCRRLGLLEAAQ